MKKPHWALLGLLAGALAASGCGGGGSSATTTPPAPAVLTVYNASADFGDVAVGASRVLALSFANTGGSSLTLQQNSLSGSGYSTSGIGSGITLQPGQYATMAVTFNPTGAGQSIGSVALTSSTSGTPMSIPLTGNGIMPVHSSALSWNASTSAVIGYNVYRETGNGSWSKINAVPVTTTSYSDWDVQAGTYYLYAVTSVSPSNIESPFSSPTSSAIPTP